MAGLINGINHFALITPDIDATVRFYRDILEMPLVGTLSTGSFRHYFFDLGNHNTLAFFEYKGVSDTGGELEAGAPKSGRQFDHLSFNVADKEALLALQTRLHEHGIEVTRVVDHDFIESIYFSDPGGISLEASYWVQDLTVRPSLKDRHPVAALQEQLEKSNSTN